MIQIQNITKKIGNKMVLKDIELNIEKGSIFGLIGENGAGKTTLIKCLTGIYKVDVGSVKIDDEEVFENNKIKQKIGYVADQNNYFTYFKIEEIIEFYKRAYDKFSVERFERLNDIFKISKEKKIKDLSKGMKMQLSLMLNFSINPEVLILDEPTSGLDAVVKKKVIKILIDEVADNGTTVFISSHHLEEIERICDNIAIIENGEIKYVNSIENMKDSIKKLQVLFEEKAQDEIKTWDEVLCVESIGRITYIIVKDYSEELQLRLKDKGAKFIEEINLSLEDIFIYSVEEELENEKCI
ncbi:ABC transporter ATP-binding protein [Tepidibacter hydrothermalis]|uniref:ABC transporter ATP-binding protein n=1 Tax=Tepidibacter hydrothermalis TaxID=3036126 RepID=A0ABY8E9F1_9FIRM|nr:ABC transporter ATP-binding protein [Tepidibacter hydrothermalis]WFD09517.1 ABC transporter ATP-binding protein [Tepidibacter hydrothermalis]